MSKTKVEGPSLNEKSQYSCIALVAQLDCAAEFPGEFVKTQIAAPSSARVWDSVGLEMESANLHFLQVPRQRQCWGGG